ncbi:hypothetical protein J31TS4_27870 [Paenibacillus sp. J31TS4]|uniref:hypothetical protein n=1 Tax=Paenibacillus sp. J31TS4 TaxID=2807195 RepID=UPI001B0CBB6C|nr:hypothetical protein [Paenibacillus sp. J31TS4]GIP39507.1 hypothetical protein J31TS4_27870 [Paenibacillus sp. J31TS4]
MACVARDPVSGLLLTRRQSNKYGLTYYGVACWETRSEAEQALEGEPGIWEVREVEEALVKRGNVKLANSDRNQLFLPAEGDVLELVRQGE